jgi:hypothetical protein
MLSLNEAGRHRNSMETLSFSFPQPTGDGIFALQASDATNTYAGVPKKVPLPQHLDSTGSHHEQRNLTQKPGTLYEMQLVGDRSAPRVSLEMD